MKKWVERERDRERERLVFTIYEVGCLYLLITSQAPT